MFDLVVFGATGYTGRLVAKYLAEHRGNVQFAIAGRSLAKLEQIKKELHLPESVGLIVANSDNAAQLEDLVKQTKAVITTVGPYLRYGSLLFGIAARAGVVYVDLTGETIWLAEMIQKHADDIRQSGSVMVSSSGYDSIPSDLAVYLAVQALQAQSVPVGLVRGEMKAKGKFSGGSFQSGIELGAASKEVRDAVDKNQYVLSPVSGPVRRTLKLAEELDQGYGSLFTLSPHNERVVYRSYGLRKQLGLDGALQPIDESFEYRELLLVSTWRKAVVNSVFVLFFGILLSLTWLHPLLKRFGPQPGTGPTEEELYTGHFSITATAHSADGKAKAAAVVSGKGDPGYRLTSVMLAESALVALDQKEHLSQIAKRAGVLTPSFLADTLIPRLEQTGLFAFTVTKEVPPASSNPATHLGAKL